MNVSYDRCMATPDPVLAEFRAALAVLYGDRIERIVLYGSRARGDAEPDSDYDIALFLKGPTDTWQEIDRIAPIEEALFDSTGAAIHTIPFAAEVWAKRTLLMHEIRKDGLDL
jgi:uncharacterized protein